MTFRQIEYIIEIMRCGSISTAARNLFVSQPYLSTVLKGLELEIGTEIFHRTSRGVELSKEGREFIGYIKPLIEQKEKILNMYKGNTENPRFHFSLSLQHFPFIIKAFIDFYQNMDSDKFSCHLRETGMYRAITDVFEKKSDIAIIYISETTENYIMRTLSSKALSFIPLSVLKPHIYIGKNHPIAAAETVCLKDMQNYPFISFEGEDMLSIDYAEEILIDGFSPGQKRFFLEDRATMYNLLVHTDGYSIGSGILPEGFAHHIISRPIAGQTETLTIGYVKLMDKILDHGVMAFLEYVKKEIELT